MTIFLYAARPGIVIGVNSAEAERIRAQLEKLTGKQVQLNILGSGRDRCATRRPGRNANGSAPVWLAFRRAMRGCCSRKERGR